VLQWRGVHAEARRTAYDFGVRHPSFRALGLSAAIAFASPLAAQQPATLRLRVVDSASRAPIPNAEVTAVTRHALTDARGEIRILWPANGTLSVRVRQLGFRYAEKTFVRGTSTSEDTAVVALAHAEFALPQAVVSAERRCRPDRDEARLALSQSSIELLRFGAEQYGNFRRAYPFAITLERRTTRPEPNRVGPRTEKVEEITDSDAWGDRYMPDAVLQHTGATSWFVPLLFVSALADSAFHARHCFVARGVETREGRRVIRLDFTPALDVRDVDWEGAAWIDSAASVLRRVEFRLTNLRNRYGPRYFEGYTMFSTPSPFIARPDSTVARWSTYGTSVGYDERASPEAVQTLVIREVTYRRERPPGAKP
jgi:hypothetical protein